MVINLGWNGQIKRMERVMQIETVNTTSKLIDALISMGPGGIIAMIMFLIYREDHKILMKYADDFKGIVQENSKAIQANTDVVRNCNVISSRVPNVS